MATAANLNQAAGQAYTNLNVLWFAGTLGAQLALFAADCAGSFLESAPNDHPIGNWLAVIAALANGTPAGLAAVGIPNATFRQSAAAAQHVASICFLAQQLNTQLLITNAQANVILAAYNARF